MHVYAISVHRCLSLQGRRVEARAKRRDRSFFPLKVMLRAGPIAPSSKVTYPFVVIRGGVPSFPVLYTGHDARIRTFLVYQVAIPPGPVNVY